MTVTDTAVVCNFCFWLYKVAGGWRRLHNEELHEFYASPNIIRVIKSRMMRWADHVVRTREVGNVDEILVGKHDVKKSFGRPRHNGKIILE